MPQISFTASTMPTTEGQLRTPLTVEMASRVVTFRPDLVDSQDDRYVYWKAGIYKDFPTTGFLSRQEFLDVAFQSGALL